MKTRESSSGHDRSAGRRIGARSCGWCRCLLATLLAVTACTTAPAEPDAERSWRLKASGTAFVNADGHRVLLRGVNAGGRSKWAPFAPFDFDASVPGDYEKQLAAYLDRAQAWGINVLRVPFTWEAVEPVKGQDDAAFLKRYDALLDAAWQRGIYTIVDCHQDVYAHVFCGDGFPAWTLPADKTYPAPHHDCKNWFEFYISSPDVNSAFDRFFSGQGGVLDAFRAMWHRMALRYRDKPGVIGFEILNEPGHSIEGLDLWAKDVLTPFMADMAARIHVDAPESLVFIDSSPFDALTFSTALQRPPGDYIVFAPHWYDAAVYLGTPISLPASATAVTAWAKVGEAWQAPVLLGESGYPNDRKESPEAIRGLYEALDKASMSFTYWEYSVTKEAWNGEALSLMRPDGKEHTALVDQVARPYVRSVAGKQLPGLTWDPVKRRLLLTDVMAGLPIHVALPQRAFQNGYYLVTDNGGCSGQVIETTVIAHGPGGILRLTAGKDGAACTFNRLGAIQFPTVAVQGL